MTWRFMMVCSGGAVGWCGAIVAPGNHQENFIDMMVNIDGGDTWRVDRQVVREVEHPMTRNALSTEPFQEAGSCISYSATDNPVPRPWKSR